MAKDIKTREIIKDIKTADKKKNLEYFEKKKDVNSKQKLNKGKDDSQQQTSKNYAVDKTINTEKQTAVQVGIKSRALIDRRRKIKKRESLQSENQIKEKTIKKNIIKKNKKDISLHSKEISSYPKIKIKSAYSGPVQSYSHDYAKRMKLHTRAKHKKKIKEAKETSSAISKGTVKALKGTFSAVKKAVTGINNIISIGTGAIVLIVIVLFIGVFSALSDDSTINSATLPVSNEVLEYKPVIEHYAKQYEMEEYVTLIMAVMMQESGGIGKDPMQSSECEYNTRYPKKPNGIIDVDYSIDCGIHYLSDCFVMAKVEGPYDMENISLALQGYNYGKGYITWALDHFGGYTRANAKVFSDEQKAKYQIDVYGDPKYVLHVLQYYHLGNGDIVMVAKSQVGNVGGKPYWSWYGFNSRVEWCACFVSWCANESGDLDKTIPKFSAVYDGMTWFKKYNKWKSSNYIPNAGDIIFFDWEQDGNPDHVGIVEKVEDGKVYTVEGNSKDECRVKHYSQNYKSILGYGIN